MSLERAEGCIEGFGVVITLPSRDLTGKIEPQAVRLCVGVDIAEECRPIGVFCMRM